MYSIPMFNFFDLLIVFVFCQAHGFRNHICSSDKWGFNMVQPIQGHLHAASKEALVWSTGYSKCQGLERPIVSTRIHNTAVRSFVLGSNLLSTYLYTTILNHCQFYTGFPMIDNPSRLELYTCITGQSFCILWPAKNGNGSQKNGGTNDKILWLFTFGHSHF